VPDARVNSEEVHRTMKTETFVKDVPLDQVLQHTLDGVFVIDQRRRCVFANEAMEKLTGYGAADLTEKECLCSELLDCRDEQGRRLGSLLCPAKIVLDGTGQTVRQKLQIRRKDGSHLWIETIYTAVRGVTAGADLVVAVVRDSTEAKLREQELLAEIASLREGRGELNATVQPASASHAQPPAAQDIAQAVHGAGAAGSDSRPGDNALRLDPLLAQCEREAILRALNAAHGQRNRAAQLMGISRSRLYRRLDALGVDLKART
jgi:PAS domain S-box-containing protein